MNLVYGETYHILITNLDPLIRNDNYPPKMNFIKEGSVHRVIFKPEDDSERFIFVDEPEDKQGLLGSKRGWHLAKECYIVLSEDLINEFFKEALDDYS